MDATLDEDFVNFESVAQACGSSALASGPDEEITLLDNEARRREKKTQGEKIRKNKDDSDVGKITSRTSGKKMKSLSQFPGPGGDISQYHLFTTFSYNCSSKRLTMIPVKYKIKEERRKVLKISVNKLKKIDDPESWLCRSVLINNTMKKLQKETRDEKMSKQPSYAKTFSLKSSEAESSSLGQSNDDDRDEEKIHRINGKESECFSEKELKDTDGKAEELFFFEDKGSKAKTTDRMPTVAGEPALRPTQDGVCRAPPNENFVEKIPSIKRCSSRKKSVDEDGTPDGILGLEPSCLSRDDQDSEDVDACDVHDVLSQLYMPPTPRMLTSIDSDTDEDELNVVDINSSYAEVKGECSKLSVEELFERVLPGKRRREGGSDDSATKKRKPDGIFGAFQESYDSFLSSNGRCEEENERTSGDSLKMPGGNQTAEEEELIELEDEEDIERRLSQSISSHYPKKLEKSCDNFFEDGCDNQYSCGHTATLFNDMQSVTFHNLIASLET